MLNDDAWEEFSFVIPTKDGGFRFYPQNMELVNAFFETWREKFKEDECCAV